MEVIKEIRLNPEQNILPAAYKTLYLVKNDRGYQVSINTQIKGTYQSLESAERVFDGVLKDYRKPKRTNYD